MKSLICILGFGLVIAGVIQGFAIIEERIYQGSVSTRGQFPWAAYLNITNDKGQNFECTGTLISDKYVITAAHCVDSANSITVFLGMQRSDDESGTMKFVVEKSGVTVYPTWKTSRGNDNIALIKLPTPVDLYKYEYVDFIRLPLKSSSSKYAEEEAVAQGWGLYNNTPVNSVELRFTPVEIMSKKECKKFFKPYPLSGGTICVEKTTRRGPCSGDSGGPLTLNMTNGDPILVGVNSYPLGACSSSVPAIYSFMGYAPYLDWINKTAGIASLGHVAGLQNPTTVAPK